MGEEWRRGWHPAHIGRKASDKRILVVGGGPAGLEAALALGQRGYDVSLAEASRELGGRLLLEQKLPGLSTWIRVRDHREHMLMKLSNVSIYRESRMSAQDIVEFGADHVLLATGSRWRRDGIGTARDMPIAIPPDAAIVTPDSFGPLSDSVMIYDDDNYYMGGALAEKLAQENHAVTYVTTQPLTSAWTQMTDEQYLVEERLVSLGVKLHVSHVLQELVPGSATFRFNLSRDPVQLEFGSLIMVTGRIPQDELYTELMSRDDAPATSRIGDCHSPSHVADAVYAGHRFAREFDLASVSPPRRERPVA